MSMIHPFIRTMRARALMLQSQAEALIDQDATAGRILGALAVVEEQAANKLEREVAEMKPPREGMDKPVTIIPRKPRHGSAPA